ncbi:MAG TPA: hypothetical protein VKQ27_04975 [Acetobacteraceae bacterium]|nr:hypothetical protein [Acetobacteraceae bacterium]
MPLRKGSSRSTVSDNIRELHTGPTYAHTESKFGKRRADKQAVAIALNVARRARAEGGAVDDGPYRGPNLGPLQGGPDLPDVGGPVGPQFSRGFDWANRAADIGSKVARGAGEGLIRDISTPGAMMKANPYPPGSEEADWYDGQRDKAATDWAPGMALNTMGASSVGMPARAAGEVLAGAGPAGRSPRPALDMAPEARAARAQEQGYNLDLYHGTSAPEFDTFKRRQNDLGIHLGTAEQANERLSYMADKRSRPQGAEPGEGDRIVPVKAAIRNPLRLSDLGTWNSDNLYYGLQQAGFPEAELRRAMASAGNESGKVAALRDLIERRGHDGVVYKNTGEVAGSEPFRAKVAEARAKIDEAFGRGKNGFTLEDQQHPAYQEWSKAQKDYETHREQNGQDSYIAFRPNQLRSPTAAFDPANRSKGMLLGSGATDRRAAGISALADVDRVLEKERASRGAEPVPAEPAAAPESGQVGPGGGGAPGGGSLPEAQAAAERRAGGRPTLTGQQGPLKIGEDYFVPGPIGKIHDVAEQYMREAHPDRPYTPPTEYHPLDPEHSKAIAQAYEEMQHTPNDPATRASYDALIKETADQYRAIKKTGLKIEPIPAGMPDPYAANPRLAAKDVADNNHLWFYPTEQGFGTVNKISDNPMLRDTGEKIGDHPMLANDMFRVVHDYFGHLKEGHGFRAAGEDNAWRTHAQMYSDIARPAMTAETRGQNSWVNYGPHGEANRKASAADTVYADQKVGLMPEWTMRDRNSPAPIMVYHGTPHTFDRFDISKIGSGEGNQAYGHGLYFAGHEPVSEWYRHQLATRQDPLLKKYGLEEVGHVIGSHLSDAGGDAAKLAAQYAQNRDQLMRDGPVQQPAYQGWHDKATSNMIDEYGRRIEYLNDPERSKGHLYQAGIHVNPEHLLDYQAPFNQQTGHVQERVDAPMSESVARQREAISRELEKGGRGVVGGRFFRPFTTSQRRDLEGRLMLLEQAGHSVFPGSEIYKRMGLPAKDANEAGVKASQRLRDLGVPGLHYPDAGSRAPGQKGSRNYVMFGDEPIKILRRYEQGGAVDRAMNVARRMRRAEGGGVDDSDVIATIPVMKQLGLKGSDITAGDVNNAMNIGMSAGPGTIGAKGMPPARMVDDTGAAMQPARGAKRYAEPEYTESGSHIINKGVENPPDPSIQTVADPYRMMFPGVYRNPRTIAEEAAARVGEEDPAMKRLFGVTRGDLREMAQGRVGNEEPRLHTVGNPRGAVSAQNIQTPQNTQRLVDILGEAGQHEGLRTADAWYIMDPVYRRMEELHGPEAAERYRKFNTLTGMASPGSDVMTEIQRGTGAHWLNEQGRFGDFQKYAGVPEGMRSSMKYPADMRYISGHPYHRTSQGDPMAKYLEAGSIQSKAPKVPLYVHASGVPETGFQTSGPVGDAHFSRGVGLSDTRKGPSDVQGSFSTSEYQTLQPWWQHDVAGKVGLESVPAQARLWTALGPQTGVESALGAPKLELLSKQIMETARRLRITPENARDLVLSGKAGAGLVAGGVMGPAVYQAMQQPEQRAAGGAVSNALAIARSLKRASGGKVHVGPIMGDTDGRADEVPMAVPDGAYVLTADHVSSLGEGNTLSGFKKLNKMFPESAKARAERKPVKRAQGGAVPIYAADGEYVICPSDIINRWGDLDEGHRYLDAWQTSSRKEHVNTLRNLAPPAQD